MLYVDEVKCGGFKAALQRYKQTANRKNKLQRNKLLKTYEPAYNRKGSKGLGSIWD